MAQCVSKDYAIAMHRHSIIPENFVEHMGLQIDSKENLDLTHTSQPLK